MIGIFDSGYGGLTVLNDILRVIPDNSYYYLGDNARAPYGPKPVQSIIDFTVQGTQFLAHQGATVIVIACNTASSVAMPTLRQQFPQITFFDVITPTIEEAIKKPKNHHIGVIGTSTTIASQSYPNAIKYLNPKIKVFTKACPLLVPLIEENWHKKPEAVSIAKKYLRSLKSCNLDLLILGCTHYPFMQDTIQKIIGKKTTVLTSGQSTAQKLLAHLTENPGPKTPSEIKIFTTTSADKFNDFIKQNFPNLPEAYSHSIVPGGLLVKS